MRLIVNIENFHRDAVPTPFPPPAGAEERYDTKVWCVSSLIGANKLGYNITIVPPGKKSFPFHNHRINEEMVFVLNGCGDLRIGGDIQPLRAGDFVAFPPGGSDLGHQIINTGDIDLSYLAVSTRMSPEIVEYPDSNKFAIVGGFSTGKNNFPFVFVGRSADSLDYWDGE